MAWTRCLIRRTGIDMTELPGLFARPEAFREAFVEGLSRMLVEHLGMGVFILVLANASYDRRIYRLLREPLRERFELLSQQLRDTLRSGRSAVDAADDLLVFLKLMAVGFDELELTAFRRVGPFELQFNPLRSYRPARMSGATVNRLSRPFDAAGFHFNKPFLRKEIFWEGELSGRDCRLLYNKFPFAELHGLLVIDALREQPQWLTEADHHLAWGLCKGLAAGLPGVGFGYNAYGAYASVNHQHLQMFVRNDQGFPVEAAHWRHNGGTDDYAAACRRFDDPDSAWRAIEALHSGNCTYNLLYRPGRLYLMPRKFQGSYRHANWTGGFAWAELSGAVTTFNRDDFDQLNAATIAAELALLRA